MTNIEFREDIFKIIIKLFIHFIAFSADWVHSWILLLMTRLVTPLRSGINLIIHFLIQKLF